MGGARQHDLGGLRLRAVQARPVARRLDRHHVAFGPAGGDAAARPLRGIQKFEQHGDHLGLVATQARIGGATVERIVGDVHLVRGVCDANDVLASEIGGLEDTSVTPGKIPSPSALHLASDLVPGSSTIREPSIGHDGYLHRMTLGCPLLRVNWWGVRTSKARGQRSALAGVRLLDTR